MEDCDKDWNDDDDTDWNDDDEDWNHYNEDWDDSDDTDEGGRVYAGDGGRNVVLTLLIQMMNMM